MLQEIVRESFKRPYFPSNMDHPENPMPKIIESLRPYATIDKSKSGSPNLPTNHLRATIPSLNGARVNIDYQTKGWSTQKASWMADGEALFEYVNGSPQQDVDQVRKILTNNGFASNS